MLWKREKHRRDSGELTVQDLHEVNIMFFEEFECRAQRDEQIYSQVEEYLHVRQLSRSLHIMLNVDDSLIACRKKHGVSPTNMDNRSVFRFFIWSHNNQHDLI